MTATERRILLALQVRVKRLEDALVVVSEALQEVMRGLESQVNDGAVEGEMGYSAVEPDLGIAVGRPPRLRRVK